MNLKSFKNVDQDLDTSVPKCFRTPRVKNGSKINNAPYQASSETETLLRSLLQCVKGQENRIQTQKNNIITADTNSSPVSFFAVSKIPKPKIVTDLD